MNSSEVWLNDIHCISFVIYDPLRFKQGKKFHTKKWSVKEDDDDDEKWMEEKLNKKKIYNKMQSRIIFSLRPFELFINNKNIYTERKIRRFFFFLHKSVKHQRNEL